MRFIEKVVCGTLAVAVGITAQEVFEAPDFNVTEALIENGVNVSAIPELAGLAVRSSLSGCSIAVGRHTAMPQHHIYSFPPIVQLTETRLRNLQTCFW
jgi:ABC-type proline/glycine betaine transport system permease subunit